MKKQKLSNLKVKKMFLSFKIISQNFTAKKAKNSGINFVKKTTISFYCSQEGFYKNVLFILHSQKYSKKSLIKVEFL